MPACHRAEQHSARAKIRSPAEALLQAAQGKLMGMMVTGKAKEVWGALRGIPPEGQGRVLLPLYPALVRAHLQYWVIANLPSSREAGKYWRESTEGNKGAHGTAASL